MNTPTPLPDPPPSEVEALTEAHGIVEYAAEGLVTGPVRRVVTPATLAVARLALSQAAELAALRARPLPDAEIDQLRSWISTAISSRSDMQGLPEFDRLVAELAALRASAQSREDEIAALRAVLREHHEHELNAGTLGLQDGEGGWIEIDNGAEYSDSAMFERTEAALAGMPPDEAQPMPRGGISAYWWQTAILLRREKRAAEAQLSAATDEIAALRAKVAELEKLVYVPGTRKCAKCGFVLVTTNMHVNHGTFSADNSPKECANGCGPMWPVTERAAGNDMVDRYEEQVARAVAAESQLSAATQRAEVLLELLAKIQPHLCLTSCPSVWRTGEPQPHRTLCREVTAALASTTDAS